MSQPELFPALETVYPPVREEVADTDTSEFYRTTSWCVEDLLQYGPASLMTALMPGSVWQDPCAGDGRIPLSVNRWVTGLESRLGLQAPRWQLIEKRESERDNLEQIQNADIEVGDYLSDTVATRFYEAPDPDVVCMDSPFTLTLRFIETIWQRYAGAHVVSFQRQSWRCGSKTVRRWIATHQPRIYTFGAHRSRPSFRADGRTDGAEYEWHVWLAHERNCREIPGGHVLCDLWSNEHER